MVDMGKDYILYFGPAFIAVASTYFTPPVPLPPGGGAQSVRPGVAAAAVGMQLPVPGSYHVGYNPGNGVGGMVRAGGGVQIRIEIRNWGSRKKKIRIGT